MRVHFEQRIHFVLCKLPIRGADNRYRDAEHGLRILKLDLQPQRVLPDGILPNHSDHTRPNHFRHRQLRANVYLLRIRRDRRQRVMLRGRRTIILRFNILSNWKSDNGDRDA